MVVKFTNQKHFMPKIKIDFQDPSQRRRRPALSHDTPIDAGTCPVTEALHLGNPKANVLWLTNAELVQLQIRVIALEQLVIVLLSEASDRQKAMAVELASAISPRPGFTPHRLTIHAAAQMTHLFGRASLFGTESPK